MSNFQRKVNRLGARRKKRVDNRFNRFLTNIARWTMLLNAKSDDAKAEYERGYDDGWNECEKENKFESKSEPVATTVDPVSTGPSTIEVLPLHEERSGE